MIKHQIRLLGLIILSFTPVSCNEDEEEQTSTVRFSTAASSANEEDGTIEVQISANQIVSSDVEIAFEVSGSAYLNGDYVLQTPSPVTLKAGTQTATITLALLDENIIESIDDEIKIKLTSIGANANLSETSIDLEHTLVITDNDNVGEDGLQIDLTWDLGEGEDIDDVNLDLYLATNVTIEDDMVSDADIYAGSENISGFETLWITSDDEDTEYYIVVNYTEGNVAADFTLNLNGGDSFSNESITETLASEDAGSAIFYGPITKSGSSIGRKRSLQKFISRGLVTQ